jgi:dihydroxycyclohexadiene carboxylate dehydrogenase
MSRFGGKTAVVTGAAQGIGRAAAQRLCAEGATVILVDRAAALCMAVRDELRRAGGAAEAVEADLETHAGARHMVAEALRFAGSIDIAVHNVGGTIWMKPFWEYAPEEIEKEIQRSLWPALWCCREVIPVMRAQGGGSIVNVGSAVTGGGAYRIPYAAAKGGVHAITLCLASELGACGVRINCVAPGGVDNAGRVVPRNPAPPSEQETAWAAETYRRTLERMPLARLGTAEEIAAVICFLAADEASYVTGQVVAVAGGSRA